MSKPLIGFIAALLLAVSLLGVTVYVQAKQNGELSSTLDIVNDANKKWAESYEQLRGDLEGRQKRLDEALLSSHVRQEEAKRKENLFRLEIDQLKESNHELKQLLESRIPDSVLSRLCNEGYASASVCEGLL